MSKKTGVIAGAFVPHAPQMLSLPKTEDAAQVARVREAMASIGQKFRELKPDLVVEVSNDHGDDYSIQSVPPFIIHCGNRAAGRDEHQGWWKLHGEVGYDILKAMQDEHFDPAFTLNAPLGTFYTIPLEFMGYSRETPFLPLFVNSYVPPQPSPERCFEFGKAFDRALKRLGLSAVLLASGGLSHYPGTRAYSDPGPDDATDEEIFKKCAEGNFRFLLSYNAEALDKSGNVEARPLLLAAGALGEERRPDVALFEPNWHHNYAVLGWTTPVELKKESLFYGATPSNRAELSCAVHALRTDQTARDKFISDPKAFASKFDLSDSEAQALIAFEQDDLRDNFGIHPLLVAGAVFAVQVQKQKADPRGKVTGHEGR